MIGVSATRASDWRRLPFQWLVCSLATFGAVASAVAKASPSVCSTAHCGLHADGSYPNYVIGKINHVGTAADVKKVYKWAKAHGYWKSLPDSPKSYVQDIKLVTISLPAKLSRHPVTVFMQQEEYAVTPLKVGDLVRYSPHGAEHDVPKGDANKLALYHGLSGCVAVLCRQGDDACYGRYRQGVFTKSQGKQVNLQTGKIVPDGLKIDPVSLLPR